MKLRVIDIVTTIIVYLKFVFQSRVAFIFKFLSFIFQFSNNILRFLQVYVVQCCLCQSLIFVSWTFSIRADRIRKKVFFVVLQSSIL